MRGLCVKTWTALPPISSTRSIALEMPPAAETWAPKSMRLRYCAVSVRVRMAPSPTGLLHIGGVRTFLFNWLFARGQGGECLLRIENTDTSREVAESVEQIERSLRWLGIEWDGDTTFQLDVMERAKEEARRLVDEGTAYEDDGAIRIRMPDDGSTGWDDAIKGRIEVPNAELEDVVLVRSDGRPTYNFASPLEDWLDGITHVIRGDDHVSNTPKQINVLRALGAEPPVYAHVPSVFGADGKKLSKRHGAVSVDEFRADGYVSEALMNFLALLGWAPDGETTIMSPRRAGRALLARPCRLEPRDLRLREARLDERRLPARPLAGRVRSAPRRLPARAGASTGRRSVFAPPRRSCRRRSAASASSRIRRLPFHDVEPDPALLDARILDAAAEALDGAIRGRAAIESALKQLCESWARSLAPSTCRFASPSPARASRRVSTRVSSCSVGTRRSSDSGRQWGRRVSALRDLVGDEFGPTSWLDVTQERIDAFAAATDDPSGSTSIPSARV